MAPRSYLSENEKVQILILVGNMALNGQRYQIPLEKMLKQYETSISNIK